MLLLLPLALLNPQIWGVHSSSSEFFPQLQPFAPFAEDLWCFYLVEVGPQITPSGVSSALPPARRTITDLFTRMDLPITKRVAITKKRVKTHSPAEDLAEGIAFWTLQWSLYESKPGDFLRFHRLAERYLRKASNEGDAIQRSFAELAYAFAAQRTFDDHLPEFLNRFGTRDSRTRNYLERLKRVYHDFHRTVPERALRAAGELEMYYSRKGITHDAQRQRDVILKEFTAFRDWRDYDRLHRRGVSD